MKKPEPEIAAYFARTTEWQAAMKKVRAIALDCGLAEELKWGKPCYTFDGSNVAILQGFKNQFALMFFKGSLLKDPKKLLQRPGANSHVAMRMEFSSVAEVVAMEKPLRNFIAAAIAIEQAGLKVETKKAPEPVPAELKALFKSTPGLKRAFEGLTPGRQRGYILHFSGAKQSATRTSRMEKCVPSILAGKGLRD